MNKCFENLIADFCAAVELPCPKKLEDGVTINHFAFGFSHQLKANGDVLFIYTDLGQASKGSERFSYYQLLRENFLDFRFKNASFGVSPITGNIVYATSYPLNKITADGLITILIDLTYHADSWRIDNVATALKPVYGTLAC